MSDEKSVLTRMGEAVDAAKEKAQEVGASIAKTAETLSTTPSAKRARRRLPLPKRRAPPRPR